VPSSFGRYFEKNLPHKSKIPNPCRETLSPPILEAHKASQMTRRRGYLAVTHFQVLPDKYTEKWGPSSLKGPSQPPPFSMPSKLFTLLGEAKLYCISVSCVPKGMFDYL